MTLDLAIVLALTGTCICTGFVAYWLGVGHAERRAKAREAELLDDLDYASKALAADPATPLLRLVGGAS